MSSTTQFYVVFAAIDVALGFPLYWSWRSHVCAWREASKGWHYAILVIAALLLVVATAMWIGMAVHTYDSWDVAMDPSRPKPQFLIVWVLGFFGYGIGLSIAQLLNLAARGRAEQWR